MASVAQAFIPVWETPFTTLTGVVDGLLTELKIYRAKSIPNLYLVKSSREIVAVATVRPGSLAISVAPSVHLNVSYQPITAALRGALNSYNGEEEEA